MRIVTDRPRNLLDKLIEAMSPARRFLCQRCGWSALRKWTDAELEELAARARVVGVDVDPTLGVLDTKSQFKGRRERRRRGRSSCSAKRSDRAEFDVFAINLKDPAGAAHIDGTPSDPLTSPWGLPKTRARRPRRKQNQRREIIATIAMSAIALFFAASLGLVGSCGNEPPTF